MIQIHSEMMESGPIDPKRDHRMSSVVEIVEELCLAKS